MGGASPTYLEEGAGVKDAVLVPPECISVPAGAGCRGPHHQQFEGGRPCSAAKYWLSELASVTAVGVVPTDIGFLDGVGVDQPNYNVFIALAGGAETLLGAGGLGRSGGRGCWGSAAMMGRTRASIEKKRNCIVLIVSSPCRVFVIPEEVNFSQLRHLGREHGFQREPG